MANKQKHKYSLGFNTRDQIKALAGSAKRRIAVCIWFLHLGVFSHKISLQVPPILLCSCLRGFTVFIMTLKCYSSFNTNYKDSIVNCI